ncbi:unnamed protein product [Sphagnum jensenii]
MSFRSRSNDKSRTKSISLANSNSTKTRIYLPSHYSDLLLQSASDPEREHHTIAYLQEYIRNVVLENCELRDSIDKQDCLAELLRTEIEAKEQEINEITQSKVEICESLFKDFFDELVELLAHLPFWLLYWKDNNKRRTSKLTHILDYQIRFGEERLPEDFEYDEKHEKLRAFQGIIVKITSFVKQNIQSLRTGEGSEKSGTTRASNNPPMHKVSGSSRGSIKKHSFYSYEDEELDVTIISSDSDFSPKSVGIEPLEFIVSQDSSDEEFVIVLESEEDIRLTVFQQRLEECKCSFYHIHQSNSIGKTFILGRTVEDANYVVLVFAEVAWPCIICAAGFDALPSLPQQLVSILPFNLALQSIAVVADSQLVLLLTNDSSQHFVAVGHRREQCDLLGFSVVRVERQPRRVLEKVVHCLLAIIAKHIGVLAYHLPVEKVHVPNEDLLRDGFTRFALIFYDYPAEVFREGHRRVVTTRQHHPIKKIFYSQGVANLQLCGGPGHKRRLVAHPAPIGFVIKTIALTNEYAEKPRHYFR